MASPGTLAQAIVDALPLPAVVVDANGAIVDLNRSAEQFFATTATSMRDRRWKDLPGLDHVDGPMLDLDHVHGCAREWVMPQHDSLILRRDDRERVLELSVCPMQGAPRGACSLLLFRDVTVERRALQRLVHLAGHDALTRLCNRREFERRLHALLGRLDQGATHTLVYIDLDRFKAVNDTAGHAAGDEILRQVASLFRAMVRERDTLARLGGDEFALILEHCGMEQAVQTARLLRTALHNADLEWHGKSFQVGMSAGIVEVRAPAADMATLLKDADAACYRAKRKGWSAIECADGASDHARTGLP